MRADVKMKSVLRLLRGCVDRHSRDRVVGQNGGRSAVAVGGDGGLVVALVCLVRLDGVGRILDPLTSRRVH